MNELLYETVILIDRNYCFRIVVVTDVSVLVLCNRLILMNCVWPFG